MIGDPCKWCSNTECDCEARLICLSEGEPGHKGCGWCIHGGPRWECLDTCGHWHPATISKSASATGEIIWTATLPDREGRAVAWRTGKTPHEAWTALQRVNAQIRAGDHRTQRLLISNVRFEADAP